MKTNSISRRLVSMLLACIMVLSMMTVGIVATSAANTDVAQTGDTITGGMTFYLKPGPEWDNGDARFAAFFCNGTSGDTWYSAHGPNTDGCYWVTVNPGESNANIIWVRMKGATTDNNWNNKWNQTADLTYDGSKNLFTITDPWAKKAGGSWSVYTPPTVDPTDPPEPTTPWVPDENYTQIAFRDDITSVDKVDTSDADMYVQFNGGSKKLMTKTVDAMSGHDMWYADIPADATSVKFIRASVIDGSTWNTWSPTLSNCTTGLYRATSLGGGAWGTTESYAIPNKKDINNYSFGIWADTRDKGDLYDLVIARKLSKSEFHLYLPSNAPQSIALYTSFAALKIGDTFVTDGTKVTLEGGKSYSMQYRQTSTDANYQPATLKVYRTTATATLVFETKRDLYTGTVGSLSVSGYKDGIETKGSYYLYGENGTWENVPVIDDKTGKEVDMSVLKKIKGRGNSSFEASMKIYGKYAYNFNLGEKLDLIDGSTAAKKWSLLANNPDVSMMRNTFIYQVADELGLACSPETRLTDVYNNGNYLGAYILTEKVEYGKNTLMAKDSNGNKINNLDDGNEEANIEEYGYYDGNGDGVVDEKDIDDECYVFDFDNLVYATDSISVGGKNYSYQYTKSDEDGHTFVSPKNYNTEYNYLLEHELSSRFKDEASWFLTPNGQPVVVKYPEFATKEEMKWIITEYATMEQAVYNNNYATYSQLIDVESFAKMYLIQELGLNLDSCATSYYIHNEFRDGKSILVAGPVWDYDWSFGSYGNPDIKKYVFNGSSVVDNSTTLDNPKQMFVKNKAIKTDANPSNGVTWASNYNLQAKLAHNTSFWTECQRIWTNDFAPILYSYLIDDYSDATDKGVLVSELLPQFESSINMNNARWGALNAGADGWGTKVTTDYEKGSGLKSSSNFKIGNTGTSGSASKSYANAIYYLNDWLVVRRNHMSGTGGLYNEALLDPVKLKSVTMTATQSGATVNVSVEIIATDNGVDISKDRLVYDLYVGGKLEGTHSASESVEVTLEENKKTEIYAVGKVLDENGNVDKTMESKKENFTYVVTGPEYKVENVKFEGKQSADESTVTVTPAATVTCDGEAVKPADINYTVYLNGAPYVTNTFETASVDVKLVEGQVNEIYVVVSPVADATKKGTSITEKYSFNVVAEKVAVTVCFKSSSSARYIPSVVYGDQTVPMTVSGNAIGMNASQTQKYFWYTADIEIDMDTATKITFKNSYSMSASTTLTLSAAATFYYGVDNLNNGSKLEDLTNASEYVRNFTKSASYMTTNDPTATGVATTSIDGTIYKMGDADGDNDISVIDATMIQMALAEKVELSDVNSDLSDFNLDGNKSITDATLVQTYLVQ